MPNIERHLTSFISMSMPGNQTLSLIGKFFSSFKNQLVLRIENDHQVWFPYCLALSKKFRDETPLHGAFPSSPSAKTTDDPIEALLADLKRIIVKHLSGNYNLNLCYAVVSTLYTLEKDIKQHNRIRFRILDPMVEAMEKEADAALPPEA